MHGKRLSNNVLFIFIFIIFILLTGCTSKSENGNETRQVEPFMETAFLMGTATKITIYDEIDNREEIVKKAFDRISQIENRMTINEETDESEVVKLSQQSGKDYYDLSPDTFFVIKKGLYFSELTKGRYDITIGPLVKLWNIGMDEAKLPSQKEIDEALKYVNYKDITLDEKNERAKLESPGMIIDLGSIAKGYAADEAARVLKEEGIKHAVVNLGGNIVAINKKPDNSYWKLGLQDPLKPTRGDYMGIVMLDDESLVTSGTYERFLEVDGKNYHHILNAETGYPEENSLLSVSIITDESIDADALSTAIFLLGLEKGLETVESLEGTEAIFITDKKEVYQTSGITDEIFEITNNEYKLQN